MPAIASAFENGQFSFSRVCALRARDGGCRFPGCTHHRFVDTHHIRHRVNGGATSLDNLVLLCRRHHRPAHEGGFGAARNAGGAIRFTRPDGRAIDEPPRLPPGGGINRFRDSNSGKSNPPIDASERVIPESVMALDPAVSGLTRIAKTQRLPVNCP